MRQISFSPPDITEAEIQEVAATLRSGWITTGPRTKQFEQNIAACCHTPRTVCLNSATAALELTLRLLGIGPGDEVITTAYTYTASASVVAHTGAKLILVDTGANTYAMDEQQLLAAITPRTKAIIPVDLAGVPCDYEAIAAIIRNQSDGFRPANELQEAIGRIAVVADSAHAFGAERHGRKTGELADFTAFSFHAVKNLTTAEGGAVTWKPIREIPDETLYRRYQLLSLHGQSKDALAKTQRGAWEYDILEPAYKCNMTDIMAAIGLVQLRRYPELLARRKEIIRCYDAAFQGEPWQVLRHYTDEYTSSGHLYLLRLPGKDEAQRNAYIRKLAERGIAANVHYKPLPMHTAYRKLGFAIEAYPNAYNMYKNEITLPLHTKLTDEDVQYIIETMQTIIKEG